MMLVSMGIELAEAKKSPKRLAGYLASRLFGQRAAILDERLPAGNAPPRFSAAAHRVSMHSGSLNTSQDRPHGQCTDPLLPANRLSPDHGRSAGKGRQYSLADGLARADRAARPAQVAKR